MGPYWRHADPEPTFKDLAQERVVHHLVRPARCRKTAATHHRDLIREHCRQIEVVEDCDHPSRQRHSRAQSA